MNNYAKTVLESGVRFDGRKLDEFKKPIIIELGISKNAEGSAKVTWGETEVVVGIKMNVGIPYPDSPDKGVLITGAELAPMSSPDFETGPPGQQAIELARVVDRGIREANMIDTKKLCIKEGELVWTVFLDIYTLNDSGNLIDAAALAAVAALSNTVFPKLEGNQIKFGEFTKNKLPINLLPITSTAVKIGNKILVDPSLDEEKAIDARITVAVSEKGDIHAMQKGGSVGLTIDEVDQMIDLAIKKSKELRKLIK